MIIKKKLFAVPDKKDIKKRAKGIISQYEKETGLVEDKDFDNIEVFEKDLKKYIFWYNNKRVKLRLKGMSPIQYWAQYYRDLIC